jgi:3-oxoacyl-[acyl-carrier protein] reductase
MSIVIGKEPIDLRLTLYDSAQCFHWVENEGRFGAVVNGMPVWVWQEDGVTYATEGIDVDILVCNAGICHTGLMSMMSEKDWDRIFAVNVKGIYNCVNAATPPFLQKQKGCIITVSSMWGQVGASCEVAYSATKGAVIAMTKALAKELGPSGVRANCVAPGVILTDMCANVAEDTLQELAEENQVGRNGTAEDVAKAIYYLAEADFITGEVLSVNGGLII